MSATNNVGLMSWSWLECWTISNVNNMLYKWSLCHAVNAVDLLSSWGIVTSSAQEWKSKWPREDKKRYSEESLTEVFLVLGIMYLILWIFAVFCHSTYIKYIYAFCAMQHECIIEYLLIQCRDMFVWCTNLNTGSKRILFVFILLGFTGHGTIKLFEYLKWNLWGQKSIRHQKPATWACLMLPGWCVVAAGIFQISAISFHLCCRSDRQMEEP